MAFSVVTNNGALAALYALNQTNQAMNKVQGQINSGLKVQTAADDASTFTIAQTMRGDLSSFKSISNALALGSGTVNVALQAATTVSDTLIQLKGKIVDAQAENVDRVAIQNDIDNLLSSINTTVGAAQFNGVNLLDGSRSGNGLNVLASMDRANASTAPTPKNINIAGQTIDTNGLGITGIDVSSTTTELKWCFDAVFADADTLDVVVGGVTKTFEFLDDPANDVPTDGDNIVVKYDSANSMGENLAVLVARMNENGISASYNSNGNLVLSGEGGVTNATATLAAGTLTDTQVTGNATQALTDINAAMNLVNTALNALGTSANQITTQKNFVENLTNTMTSAVGQLVDADMAAASAELQSLQTRQQLGIQALSIANSQPGSILALFRG